MKKLLPILLTTLLAPPGAPGAPPPLELRSRLELMVDRFLVDRLDGAEMRLCRPVDKGSVLAFDAPWDGRYAGYVTVIKDGTVYRMYYRGQPTIEHPSGSRDEVTCYAESADGMAWRKPDLGLYQAYGTRHNNVILDGSFAPIPTDFTPFLDTRPGVPAGERFKALGGYFDGPGRMPITSGGLIALVSGDGIHWRKLRPTAVIGKESYPYDVDPSQQSAFWSEAEHCYVAYVRTRTTFADIAAMRSGRSRRPNPVDIERGPMRWIGRAASADFVHWSKVEMMAYASPPLEQIYNNNTGPYFRAPHIYLGLAARIVFDRPVVTHEQALMTGVDPKHAFDSSEAVLLTSRGGTAYDREFMGALVRNKIGPQHWTSRDNYPALNIIPTGPEEMSFFTQEETGLVGNHLERYALGIDRVASITAPLGGGELLTKPLTFTGKNLLLNFSTSVAGGIRVEIEDAAGHPIPGFGLSEAVDTIGNDLERVAAWKGGSDVSRLSGTPVRLRFLLNEADLYALRFK